MSTKPKSNPVKDYWLSKLLIEIADKKVGELAGELKYLGRLMSQLDRL